MHPRRIVLAILGTGAVLATAGAKSG